VPGDVILPLNRQAQIMKLTVLLLLAASLHISAYAHSQVTISETNVSLTKVFRQIEQQTGYTFWYNNSLLEKANAVTIKVKKCIARSGISGLF
jgi:TonB-dependent starch-binding outer membrane protein SusC